MAVSWKHVETQVEVIGDTKVDEGVRVMPADDERARLEDETGKTEDTVVLTTTVALDDSTGAIDDETVVEGDDVTGMVVEDCVSELEIALANEMLLLIIVTLDDKDSDVVAEAAIEGGTRLVESSAGEETEHAGQTAMVLVST